MTRPPVIVVGMHRSGTSLVGAILAAMGIDMGQTAVGDPYNPSGYFEDLALLRLNEAQLASLGGRWDAPPSAERIQAERQGLAEAYATYAAGKTGRWGAKDPRVSLFLGAFLEAVPDAQVVHAVRDTTAVARSLAVRDGLSEVAALALRSRYEAGIAEGLGARAALAVDYDRLCAAPDLVLDEIAGAVDLPVSAEVRAVLQPDGRLRRAKRRALVTTLASDARRVLANPRLLLQRRAYLRAGAYMRAARATLRREA